MRPRRPLVTLLLLASAALPLSAQRPQGTKLPVPGGFITYYERGPRQGTPLIMVSGGPGFESGYFWFRPWGGFETSHRNVRYDQRGTGTSSPVGPNDKVSVAQFVADIEALRVALKADKIDLLGHSWGGYLSMAYAAKHPDRLAHLILLDAAAPKFSDTRFLFAEAFPDRGAFLEQFARGVESGGATLDSALVSYLGSIFYAPENATAFIKQIGNARFNRFQHKQLSAEMSATDLSPAMRRLKVKTLVVSGRYDMNVAPSTAFAIHRMIPGSEFVIFEKSSHMPFYEEGTKFGSVLKGFLAR